MRPGTSEPADAAPAPRRALPFGLNPTFVRETAWLAGGFASKLVINLGTLYFLTRALGVASTGTFFAVISLLACLVPFVQLGNYDITVRQIARRQDPRAVAGRALRSSAAMFICVLPVVALLRPLLAPQVGLPAFLMVTTGELLVMRVIGNVQAVATGFRHHYVTALSDFTLGASRFAATFAAWRVGAGIDTVLMLYAFTALPTALGAYGWLVRQIGPPTIRGGPIFAEVAEHLRMVVAWFCEMAGREGDKPLLNRVAGSQQTGIYGTATKLLTVMLVPIDVLSQVFRPRISRAYVDGHAHGQRLYRMMVLALTGCGALTGAAMLAGAFALPHVAPNLLVGGFAETRVALMYLSIIPPIYGLQRANVIGAIARYQTGTYATSMVISAVAGVATLLATGGSFGWRGACLASTVYMSVSCVATWVTARGAARRPAGAGDSVDVVLPAIEAAIAQ